MVGMILGEMVDIFSQSVKSESGSGTRRIQSLGIPTNNVYKNWEHCISSSTELSWTQRCGESILM